ncbi:TetR/AcrR family transcriptional regulator [Varunaivibrio sulfuroxidans]|uniref:TetR family transcriptional regulator n=1 Tax=Varunaivibrio sulfuroxidans TaxID=1773489 RepID=A0A4R3JCJ9_9PROT|nr:TetR/AcrR family transcriptional regulator [Varunaivibrio sulfuroxidans]TCS63394.1 TetR family transcriptional regulator [Varunaivibrio sulfuroxidans]WES30459.1 TetR/AcrR family transcriptional regulator [Varunaivibrio sulfuroxidans]
MHAQSGQQRREPSPEPRPPTKRTRLSREEREKQIIDGAIRFFAEVGFEGKTRDLAKRLGITQPLLYRYFDSKETLIERVYQELFIARWDPKWETLIRQRKRTLEDRLITFYKEYYRATFNYEWVRILVFAGLKGVDINGRYIEIVRDKWILPVCEELRLFAGLPPACEIPITDEEMEIGWELHGSFFYMAVRKWVYTMAVPGDVEPIIERMIRLFLNGARDTLRTQIET